MKGLLGSVSNPLEGLEENETSGSAVFLLIYSLTTSHHRAVKAAEPLGRESLSVIRSQGYLVASDMAKQDISRGQVGNSESSAQCVLEKLDWILLRNFLS